MKRNFKTSASQISATDFKADTDLQKKYNFSNSIFALKILHGVG